MAKLKNPTPQELYKARKEREEQERNALLPPGLYNHGNTCFMNSVLQGLIATPLLYDLACPAQSTSSSRGFDTSSILLRRSPQLTNGHNLGGEYEREWVEGMPLGDVFFNLMMKAWSAQRNYQRTNLSAKEVLNAIGKKYDQYLDFAQQDAHECLRQLLDSMRMEEMDIIKKRQPPPPQERKKHRRRTTITPSPLSSFSHDPERLSSVADMIFGGKLTSILVCQICKHVSQTYEEFNDLSLSIKPEDYVRERKRDRLKNLAKKLANFNTSSPVVTPTPRSSTPSNGVIDTQRSSSVPPSPRRSEQTLPPAPDDRSRSMDGGERTSAEGVNESGAQSGKQSSEVMIEQNEEKPDKKAKKDKDKSDPWVKISKRISMTVGLGKSKDRRDKRKSGVPSPSDDAAVQTASSARTSVSDVGGPEIRVVRPSSEPERRVLSNGSSPLHQSSISPVSPIPSIASNTSPPQNSKRSSSHRPPKPPRPFKPSAAEIQYLRQVLADVPPASSNPFAIFRPHSNGISSHHNSSSSLAPTTAQNMWMKISQLQSIEECLRLFTAVEVLDGENMVGCRRCWKIQNGVYKPPAPEDGHEDESDSEEDAELPTPPVITTNGYLSDGGLAPAQDPPLPTSLSSPSLGLYTHQDLGGTGSTSSLPSSLTSTTNISSLNYKRTSVPPPLLPRSPGFYRPNTPGGLPIPLIATVAPDSPVLSPPSTARAEAFPPIESPSNSPDNRTNSSTPMPPSLTRARNPDRDSLHAPRLNRRQTADVGSTTDDDSGGEESDASTTSAFSTTYTNASSPSLTSNTQDSPPLPHAQPNFQALDTPKVPDQSFPSHHPNNVNGNRKKPPKPTILRPAYKRYLIATPPPILVIHLKRFQQLSKTPIMSFSHGFKKVDDYVSFPEMLDLSPYLAPRKEDFGLGSRRGHGHGHGEPGSGARVAGAGMKTKESQKCMYRLYAVVVHIGNMLGGHYVAYTALPAAPIPSVEAQSPPPTSASSEKPGSHTASRQWAYISDTVVRLTTLEEVLKAKAYLCMYERI